jgi:hypothetical protein
MSNSRQTASHMLSGAPTAENGVATWEQDGIDQLGHADLALEIDGQLRSLLCLRSTIVPGIQTLLGSGLSCITAAPIVFFHHDRLLHKLGVLEVADQIWVHESHGSCRRKGCVLWNSGGRSASGPTGLLLMVTGDSTGMMVVVMIVVVEMWWRSVLSGCGVWLIGGWRVGSCSSCVNSLESTSRRRRWMCRDTTDRASAAASADYSVRRLSISIAASSRRRLSGGWSVRILARRGRK